MKNLARIPESDFVARFDRVAVPRSLMVRTHNNREVTTTREQFFDSVGNSLMGHLAMRAFMHERTITLEPTIRRPGDAPAEIMHELWLRNVKPVAFALEASDEDEGLKVTFGKYPLSRRLIAALSQIQEIENKFGNDIH